MEQLYMDDTIYSLYSIMDVIKDVEEVGLNHGAIYMDDTI